MRKVRLELGFSDGESTALTAAIPGRQTVTKVKIEGVDALKVLVKKLHPEAMIPGRGTPLSSGLDLHALDVVKAENVKKPYDTETAAFTVRAGERVLVRTGLALQMEAGIEAQVRPRSGLALKHGITVLNTPGTVDADYTGDVGIVLWNTSREPFEIRKGDRVAQLVFAPVLHNVKLVEAAELAETERGAGAYGHTGTKGGCK
ncbi:dUTPase [Pelotomaculum thermopropionicum SI]|uniref:dUTP diphosphatase n=1 Tax=Pelotomaculum thermopropionicum (strain DSM 13744 / JCM 10971 / SI) TaxID=370438 RepID=A5D0A9_PELTS|nr:dUTPase [Pelotomaculum thermopropionicum SI]